MWTYFPLTTPTTKDISWNLTGYYSLRQPGCGLKNSLVFWWLSPLILIRENLFPPHVSKTQEHVAFTFTGNMSELLEKTNNNTDKSKLDFDSLLTIQQWILMARPEYRKQSCKITYVIGSNFWHLAEADDEWDEKRDYYKLMDNACAL